jgi:transposase
VIVRRQSTLEATLPAGHLARFVWETLASMDFSEVEGRYRSVQGGPGRPPYHPRVLSALWIYGMMLGLETAAAIAEACGMRDDLRWLAGGLHPSDQTLLNLLDLQPELSLLWEQVLRAMHQAGHIDLSAIAEDGSKLRANASPRSFHTAEEIDAVIVQLKARIEEKLKQATTCQGVTTDNGREQAAKTSSLQHQLKRAERAAQELRERAERRPREARADGSGHHEPRFGRADFSHDAERDVLVCPAGRQLRFVGVYPGRSGKHRLYGRADCSD